MKRIIDGVTYNTGTSTALALKTWHQDGAQSRRESDWIATLYQTRSGAFFVVNREEYQAWNQQKAEHEGREAVSLEPLSPDEARTWIRDGGVHVFSNPFEKPAEAAAETDAGATLYVRVPASLKRRVEEKAEEARLSGNELVMRCLERYLELTPEQLEAMTQLLAAVKAQRSSLGADGIAEALTRCEELGL